MQKIVSFLFIILGNMTWSVPINNGFTLKFKSGSSKEEFKPKIFGALFAKIPQDIDPDIYQKEMFSKAYFAHSNELGTGCSNQIAKIIVPEKNSDESSEQINEDDNNNYKYVFNNEKILNNYKYMNIPLIDQPYKDYKIVVATAPYNVKLSGDDAKPVVVYLVFPEAEESNSINIPKIYFVNKGTKIEDVQKHVKAEPVIIVDSNRTVTGLKSNEVAKSIKFKNKLTNRFNYILA